MRLALSNLRVAPISAQAAAISSADGSVATPGTVVVDVSLAFRRRLARREDRCGHHRAAQAQTQKRTKPPAPFAFGYRQVFTTLRYARPANPQCAPLSPASPTPAGA